MTRFPFSTCLACLLLTAAGAASGQTAPANVVTPAPPPREGTVGPEQLRDFALPGTRNAPAPTPTPAPAATPRSESPQTPPAAAAPRRPAAPAASAPASERREQRPAGEIAAERAPASPSPPAGSGEPRPTEAVAPPAGQVTIGLGAPAPATTTSSDPLPLPSPAPLPETGVASGSTWWSGSWPWLAVAALLGVALALFMRRKRPERAVASGLATDPQPAPRAPPPAPPPPLPPVPKDTSPPVPAGLVTSRLRSAPAAEPRDTPPLPGGLVSTRLRPPPAAAPVADLPAGAVVSTRLRPWLDLDLRLEQLVFTEAEAVLRFRLTLLNGGTAAARDIVIEALALNAGETQSDELATFYARPDGPQVSIASLDRLGSGEIVHEVRMPRGAIRAYEAQGRTLFVPILAFNVAYRWANGIGRTSAAFLVGHQQAGSERLAPIRLETGDARLGGLGVRRLEEQVRR